MEGHNVPEQYPDRAPPGYRVYGAAKTPKYHLVTEASGEFASFCGDSGDGLSVLFGLAGKAQQLLHYPVHLFVVHDSMVWVRGMMTVLDSRPSLC